MFQTLHVNEFPKCGGTWLCKVLAQGLGWRFDDNAYPWFGNSLIKHHRLTLPGIQPKRVITLVRDPRDVAVSFFHYSRSLKSDSAFNSGIVALMAEDVFKAEQSEEEALERFVTHMVKDPVFPRFTWGQFYGHAAREGSHFVRYEDLRADTFGTLVRACEALGQSFDPAKLQSAVAAHDIGRVLAAREDGDDPRKYFVRSGKVGEGMEVLSRRSLKQIEADAGTLLQRFGYQ